jgi:hypothetical protein
LTILSSVVFPHPDGPSKTTNRPGSIARDTSTTEGRVAPGKVLAIRSKAIELDLAA